MSWNYIYACSNIIKIAMVLKAAKKDIEEIIQERFNINFFHRNKKIERKHLSSIEISRRKHSAAKIMRDEINNSPELQQFFDWIFEIKKKSGFKTNKEFARVLGLRTVRTIYNWKEKKGFFPSKKVVERLLHLERLTKIKVIRNNKNP